MFRACRLLGLTLGALPVVASAQQTAAVNGQALAFWRVGALHGGSVTVSMANDSVWMLVSTDRGSFGVHLDSLTMATWADSAKAAHPPKPHGKKLDYTSSRIMYYDSLLHATVGVEFVRLSADSASPYQCSATNGAWVGTIVLPFDSAQMLFRVMRAPPLPIEAPADSNKKIFADFEVAQQARADPNGQQPVYPWPLRLRKIQGQVLTQFVVDTFGRAELPSFKILRSSHPLFSLAIYETVAGMRFTPAMADGKKVRELVQQPYVFNLSR